MAFPFVNAKTLTDLPETRPFPGRTLLSRQFAKRKPVLPPLQSRQARFETIEPRVLLSADSLIGGLSSTLAGGLDDLGDMFEELIDGDALFETNVPGVMQPGAESLDLVQIKDLLSKDLADFGGGIPGVLADGYDTDGDNVVQWDEAFRGIFVDQVQDWLGAYTLDGADFDAQMLNLRADLSSYLDTGLAVPGSLDSYFDIDISNVTTSFNDEGHFSVELDLELELEYDLFADLGAQADQLEIAINETNTLIPIKGGISITDLEFGVNLDTDNDATSFFMGIPGDITVGVDANVAWDFDINVGFLGTTATGAFVIDAAVDAEMVDPSHPDAIGIEDTQLLVNFNGTFTADEALPVDGVLHSDIILDVTLASTTTRVTIDAGDYTDPAGLLTKISAELDTSGLDDILTASLDIDNKLVLSVDGVDPSPLMFSDNQGPATTLTATAVSPLLGGTSSTQIVFLLSLGGALPQRITVNTTPVDDDHDGMGPGMGVEGDLDIGGLVADVQAAIDAKFAGITVGKDGSDKLTLNAGGTSLEITQTFSLGTDNIITQAELGVTPITELIETQATDTGLDTDLTLTVITGDLLDWAAAPTVHLMADVNAFTEVTTTVIEEVTKLNFDLTEDGSVRILDTLESSDWQQLLDFNVIGPNEIVSLIGQLGTWLERLQDTQLLGAFDLPLVDATIGEILDFRDLVNDVLLFDDGDDDAGGDIADVNKLLSYDGTQFFLEFNNAQNLTSKLASILGVSNTDIAAAYDPGNKELTYDVSLEHTFFGSDGISFDVDFDADNFLGGMGALVDIFAEGSVQLDVTGYVDAVLGFTLGDAVGAIEDSTPLSELNGDQGVVINEHLALTSASPIEPLIGRLSEDATFYITVDKDGDLTNDSPVEVTVYRETNGTQNGTNTNQTLTDLIDDINAALTDASLDGDIVAVGVEGRVVLQAVGSDVNVFQVSSSSGNTAFSELGLQLQTAATVSLLGTSVTDVSPDAQIQLDIVVYKNGTPTAATITLAAADTSANNTLTDLVIDINAALDDAGLLGELLATREGDQIRFSAVHKAIESFTVAPNSGLASSIGFGSLGLAALELRGPEMATTFGQLSGPVSFDINLERTSGGALSGTISLTANETNGTVGDANASVDDLVADINSKISGTALSGQLTAINDGFHILFRATDSTVDSIEISGLSGAEQDDLGLVNATVTPILQVAANKAAPETYGVDTDTSFTLTVTDDGVTTPYTIELTREDTLTNRSVYDLAGDLNRAINEAFLDAGDVNPFSIVVQTGSLVIGLKTGDPADVGTSLLGDLRPDVSDDITAFSISGAPAELALNASADSADLIVETLDGAVYRVELDSLPANPTVGQVLAAINAQTSNVLAEKGDDLASIKLTDSSTPDGMSDFRVRMVNGSPAAIGLGLFASGLNQLEEFDESNGPAPTANIIEGAAIATVPLIDRFFIKEQAGKDLLRAELELSLPEGLEAGAAFGFAGIRLYSEGAAVAPEGDAEPIDLFNARLNLGLSGQQTLGNLLTSLGNNSDLLSVVEIPTLVTDGDNDFRLRVEVQPDLDIIGLGSAAALDFTLGGLGTMALDGDQLRVTTLPDISVAGFDLDDLANFEAVRFDNVLDALDAIVDFLNQFSQFSFLDTEIPVLGISFNEVLDIADRFEQAVEDVRLDPAGGIQLLEQKIRESFNLPDFASNIERDAFFDNLGIPDPEDLFNMVLDGVSDELLRIDLRLPIGFSEGLSLDFDLGEVTALGGLIDLQGGAGLNVNGYLDARLSFAVDLDTLDVFLYDGISGIEGSLSAGAENVTFNAAIGPLAGFIKDGVVNAEIDFAFENLAAADDQKTLVFDFSEGTSSIGTVFGSFAPSLTGGIEAVLPVYFPGDSVYLGDIALNMTGLSLTGNALNLPDLTAPGVLTLPDFSSIDLSSLSPFDSIPLMLDGLDFFLMGLQDILDGEVFGFELPFIGDKLAGGADFIETLRLDVLDPIRTLTEEAPELGEDLIQYLLFAILGPGSEALNTFNNFGGQNLEDFLGLSTHIEGLDLLTNYATGEALPDFSGFDLGEFDNLLDDFLAFGEGGITDGIEWQFRLGDTFTPPVDIDFDLGFPGLNLDVDAPLNVEFIWDLALGIGVNQDDGVYLLIDNERDVLIDGLSTTISDELYIGVTATLDESASIHGELGFLQLDITPLTDDFDSVLLGDTPTENDFAGDAEGDPTQFSASFMVDLVNKDDAADTRLSFSELGKLDANIDLTAEAEVNLFIEAKFNEALLPDAITALLPAVSTNFVFDWAINAGILTGDLDIADSLHILAFNDVHMDMGSFLSDFLGPVLGQIQEITGPMQPIIDIVTAPIPVISDLFGPTTLLDIAGMTGYVEPAMIYAIADIISLANSIPSPDDVGALLIPLGSFALIGPTGGDTGGLAGFLTDPNYSFSGDPGGDSEGFAFGDAFAGLDDTIGGVTDLISDGLALGGDATTADTATSVLNNSGGASNSGFAFPIFENPSQIFGLLLGQDPVLVTYDLAPFGFDLSYTQKFPIWGPIFGSLSMSAGMVIDLAFGYDTFGARTFAEGGFENPLDLLAGFYVSDTDQPDGSGTDVPELVLTGELFAGVEVSIGVASVGVEGGIILTTNFDLYDPDSDGRVRINELLGSFLHEWRTGSPLLAPVAIFDVFGDVAAQLRAFVEFLTFSKKFEITPPITLFEFSIDFDREPILATERGDGSLLLNIGPNSESRLNGDTRDIAESINVESISDNKVRVWSDQFGVSKSAAQEYTIGTNKLIEAYGGQANDTIDLSLVTHTNISFYVEGGTGDDIIKSGAGTAELFGNEGADTLEGGDSADIIFGGDGPDTIKGMGGDDMLFGDGGRISYDNEVRSRIFVLVGEGDGADNIEGGDGHDIIFGGGDSDLIQGGLLNDLIIGDGGRLDFATSGDPALSTGNLAMANGKVDTSVISSRGEGARDRLFGNAGDDTILGGSGSDLIDGAEGEDQLFGDAGFDVIYGGSDADDIFGGTEDDIIFGYRDPEYTPVLGAPAEDGDASLDAGDYIEGQDGNDYIRGNRGDDTIFGNRGADIIFGDEQDDTIEGNAGPDVIFGGAHNDTIEAGDGSDIVFGDDGLLVYYGFYADPTRPVDDGIAVDSGITGSLIRVNAVSGDRLIGDGPEALATTFADFDDDNTTYDSNDRSLDLIITHVDNTTDGNDTITGGNSLDFVFGGAGNDTIYGDFDPNNVPPGPRPTGSDVLIGDGGRLEYQDRRYSYVGTILNSDKDGLDTLVGNDGDDYLFGGGNDDLLYGFEVMTGDNASSGNDLLSGVSDHDIIIGDNGEIQFDAGIVELITANDPSNLTGGDDQAFGYKGNDIILGGANTLGTTDILFGSQGDDVLLGDNGVLDYDTGDGDLSTLDLVESTTDGVGGHDQISGDAGADILIGGTGGDELFGDNASATHGAGDLNDIILGDNGKVVFDGAGPGKLNIFDSAVTLIATTDLIETHGGADTIEGNAGADVILGGVNNDDASGDPEIDRLYGDAATPAVALDGSDVILGDNGLLDFAFGTDTDLNTLDLISSTRDGLGGTDFISGNAGGDTLLGGTGGDLIYGDDDVASAAGSDGEDIILGDNGDIALTGSVGRLKILDDAVELIMTTDVIETHGGADTIEGNAAADVILGGVNNGGNDHLYGDAETPVVALDAADVILGDNGELDFALDADTDLNTLDLIRSYDDNWGGKDFLSGNADGDTLIGGTGGDEIRGDDASASAAGSDGDDIALGDNADIFLIGLNGARLVLGSSVDRIRTTDDAELTGGADLIEGNAGADILVGGVNNGGQDDIYGDAVSPVGSLDGDDIILGDNAELDWTFTDADDRDTLDWINSLAYANDDTTLLGERDNIFGNAGNDVAIGGSGGDLIIGDNDENATSKTPGAADTLETFAGEDILLGDQGQIVYANGKVTLIETTDQLESDGGVDYIEGNDHSDILLGGVAGDLLIGESQFGNSTQQGFDYVGTPGDDIILGDEGRLVYDAADGVEVSTFAGDAQALGDGNPDTLDLIETFATGNVSGDPIGSLGGIDTIFGNEGSDVAMGGTDGDHIYGDFYAALTLDGAWSVSAVGTASAPAPGSDTLIGDGGQVAYRTLGAVAPVALADLDYTLIRSIEQGQGGFDRIQGNDLGDRIIGGFDGDWLWGEAPYDDLGLVQDGADEPRGGDDWILGDNGRFDYVLLNDSVDGRPDVPDPVVLDVNPGTLDRVSTTDPTLGGDDIIRGNAANDTIFGGTGKDRIWGDTHDSEGDVSADGADGKDLIFGDHGKVYPNVLDTLDYSYLNNNFFAIDTQDTDLGNDDVIFGNGNEDTILGQQGDDVIFGGTDNDILIGGHNVVGGHDEMDAMDLAQKNAILSNVLADRNPIDTNDINDVMDGGSEDDILAGDNAIVIRQTDSISPRFQYLTDTAMYSLVDQDLASGLFAVDVGFTPNIAGVPQARPGSTVGYTVTLLDHSDAIELSAAGTPNDSRVFGNDVIAGGSEDDLLFGQLGDDIMQGDGIVELQATAELTSYDPSPTAEPSFTVPDGLNYFEVDDDLENNMTDEGQRLLFHVIEEHNSEHFEVATGVHFDEAHVHADGDDYLEGNGGNDRMYGNLGQDDMIGGSSILFGLDDVTAVFFGLGSDDFARPDGADLMYGSAGDPERLARNDFLGDGTVAPGVDSLIPTENRHARDADVMLGDNANIYRLVRGGDAYPVTLEAPYSYSYLTFSYDLNSVEDRGELHVIPRAVELLDYSYTYSFDDVDVSASFAGIGFGDLMFGESGDDILHGMTGDDVLFGNSEDDDLYGEVGADWISGGTGIDGILGDDGLLFTSRNDTNDEPLYGVAALDPDEGPLKRNQEVNTNSLNAVISTPGDIQRAVINVEDELKKSVDLIGFDTGGIEFLTTSLDEVRLGSSFNDILYGGWGSDWIHAGDGDDAVSGAEALGLFYSNGNAGGQTANALLQQQQENTTLKVFAAENPFWFSIAPYNPGDILRYEGNTLSDTEDPHGKTRQEFALYDEFSPRRKIMLDGNGDAVVLDDDAVYDFLLNFNQLEGPQGFAFEGDDGPMATDGDDRLFGDTGNDWMVGGTGRDHMFGGRGDDLLNMDDDHDTETFQPKPKPKQVDGDLENNQPDEYQAYADIAYGGAGRDIMLLNTGADRATDWVGEYNSYIVPFSPFGAFHIARTLQPQLPEFLLDLSVSDGADQSIPHGALYVEQKSADVRVDDPSDPEFAFRNGEPYGELGLIRQTDFDWQEQTGAPNDPQPGNLQGKREIMRRELFSDSATTAFAADVGDFVVTNGAMTATPELLGEETVSLFYLDQYQPSYMEILVTINAEKDRAGSKSNAYVIFDYKSAEDFKFAGVEVGTDKVQIGHRDATGWVVDTQTQMQLKANRDYDLTVVLFGSVVTIYVDQGVNVSMDFGEPLNDDGYLGLGTVNAIAHFDDFQVQQLPPTWTFTNSEDFSGTGNGFAERGGIWEQNDGSLTGTATSTPAITTQFLDVAPYSRLEMVATLETAGQGGVVFDYYSDQDFKYAALDANTNQVVIGHYTSHGWSIDAATDYAVVASKSYELMVTMFGTSVSVAVNGQAVIAHVFNGLLNDANFGLLSADGSTSFDDFLVRGDDSAYSTALMASVPGAHIDSSTAATPPPTAQQLKSHFDAAISTWDGLMDMSLARGLELRVEDLPGLMLGRLEDNVLSIDLNAAGHGWFIDPTPLANEEFDVNGQAIDGRAAGSIDLLTVLTHELGHTGGLAHASDGVMDNLLSTGVRLHPSMMGASDGVMDNLLNTGVPLHPSVTGASGAGLPTDASPNSHAYLRDGALDGYRLTNVERPFVPRVNFSGTSETRSLAPLALENDGHDWVAYGVDAGEARDRGLIDSPDSDDTNHLWENVSDDQDFAPSAGIIDWGLTRTNPEVN